ncbi:MAG: DUF6273 domain-containing protein [Clostridiales Family XIII bacterium]|jgi:hypothetical protein|nr:DUF6273 domain-containing protein [Clostridiales Family XIII bacterium]
MAKSLQQINLEFKKECDFEKKPAGLPRFADILRAASAEFRYRGKAEIEMGGVAWRALATENDAILLISKEILGLRKFHGEPPFRGWRESDIRAYLNGAFLGAFPAEARELIREIEHRTARSADGDEDVASRDGIFLLSFDEARDGEYFADEKDRAAAYDGESWWWWLRCPGAGFDVKSAASDMVMAVDKNGLFNRAYVDLAMGGVRPALWMELSGAGV